MSEDTVDVNSRTSLAKRWWHLNRTHFTAKGVTVTTVLNLVFAAVAVWQYIGPMYVSNATGSQTAKIAQLETDLGNALSRATTAEDTAGKLKLGYEASQQDNAALAKVNDDLRKKLEFTAQGEGEKKQVVAAAPTVKKVRTKPVPAPKDDTLTCAEIEACAAIVAWYEKNVATGSN